MKSLSTGGPERPLMNRSSRHRTCTLALGTLLVCTMAPCVSASAQDVEIHRCAQEDGTIAFQETPCPEPADDDDAEPKEEAEAPAASDGFFDFVNPYDESDEPPQPSEPALPKALTQDRADCEKTTRDAIDAIDLEMRKGYSKEDGKHYLADLLELTQQLRACKQL